MLAPASFRVLASGLGLKFPIGAYRRLPLTPHLEVLNWTTAWPTTHETLGFVAALKASAIREFE